MDGIATVAANPVDDVNRILQMATDQNLDLAKKMVKVAVETAVAGEAGKGQAIDVSA
jgi:hypothetical protein